MLLIDSFAIIKKKLLKKLKDDCTLVENLTVRSDHNRYDDSRNILDFIGSMVTVYRFLELLRCVRPFTDNLISLTIKTYNARKSRSDISRDNERDCTKTNC